MLSNVVDTVLCTNRSNVCVGFVLHVAVDVKMYEASVYWLLCGWDQCMWMWTGTVSVVGAFWYVMPAMRIEGGSSRSLGAMDVSTYVSTDHVRT